MGSWFCSPPALQHGMRTSSNLSHCRHLPQQLRKAGVDKRVGKEPPAKAVGLAPRQPSCSTAQAGGIRTVPPQAWELCQEKQMYK